MAAKASAQRVVKTGRKGAVVTQTSSGVSVKKFSADSEPIVPMEDKLDQLVAGLGNNRVAELLDVSPSQPSRWRSRKEGITSENERRVVDLEYVMSRLLRLFTREVAQTWLVSHNAHLGSRPIDVLKLSGALPVIEALDAEEQGAFA